VTELVPVAILSGFVLVGVVMAVNGAYGLRHWWEMRGLDPVGPDIESGLQELEGTARSVDGTVEAPFSRRDSLVCEWRIERYDHDDDGGNWRTVADEREAVPFAVDHAGATVAVDPEGATALLTREFHVDSKHDDALPEPVESYLREHTTEIDLGIAEFRTGRYRFVEERLHPDEAVYVLGPVSRDPGRVEGSDARYAVGLSRTGIRSRLSGPPFVLSDTGESTAERRQLKRGLVSFGFGLVFAGLATAMLWTVAMP